MPRVRMIGTGGTIARTPDGTLSIAELINSIGSTYPSDSPHDRAILDFVDVMSAGSEEFTTSDWVMIGHAVQRAVSDEQVDGVVLTHGTFTLEETAYFLHLTVDTQKPMVLVCSQRRHSSPGNDGDRNLLDAIRVAADSSMAGTGAVVVVNEGIHTARGIEKISGRPDGFVSANNGLLGSVGRDRVVLYRSPRRRHTHASEFSIPEVIPRVDIVATYAGADGTVVEALVERGVDGLIVTGFPFNGMPHPLQADALHAAVKNGIPVVVVNRGGGGRVPPDAYNDGFVLGDDLTGQQARVLLSVALGHQIRHNDLQRVFDEY